MGEQEDAIIAGAHPGDRYPLRIRIVETVFSVHSEVSSGTRVLAFEKPAGWPVLLCRD